MKKIILHSVLILLLLPTSSCYYRISGLKSLRNDYTRPHEGYLLFYSDKENLFSFYENYTKDYKIKIYSKKSSYFYKQNRCLIKLEFLGNKGLDYNLFEKAVRVPWALLSMFSFGIIPYQESENYSIDVKIMDSNKIMKDANYSSKLKLVTNISFFGSLLYPIKKDSFTSKMGLGSKIYKLLTKDVLKKIAADYDRLVYCHGPKI